MEKAPTPVETKTAPADAAGIRAGGESDLQQCLVNLEAALRRVIRGKGEAVRLSLHTVRHVTVCLAESRIRIRPKPAHGSAVQNEVSKFVSYGESL